MGAEQAAAVMATIRRDQIEQKGGTWTGEQEDEYKQPILDSYQMQGHSYYASARLWDDGVIDPSQTRATIARCLEITNNAPIAESRFGTFRM
jgi:3-methylcrotonyl-CoA carboxylase beta subunit